LIQSLQDFGSKALVDGGLFAFQREGAAGFEDAAFELIDMTETLTAAHQRQLGFGEQFLGQRLVADLAVLIELEAIAVLLGPVGEGEPLAPAEDRTRPGAA